MLKSKRQLEREIELRRRIDALAPPPEDSEPWEIEGDAWNRLQLLAAERARNNVLRCGECCPCGVCARWRWDQAETEGKNE